MYERAPAATTAAPEQQSSDGLLPIGFMKEEKQGRRGPKTGTQAKVPIVMGTPKRRMRNSRLNEVEEAISFVLRWSTGNGLLQV